MISGRTGFDGIAKDAKSPDFGVRLPYLDVHYGLPYGRAYLPFSPFHYIVNLLFLTFLLSNESEYGTVVLRVR